MTLAAADPLPLRILVLLASSRIWLMVAYGIFSSFLLIAEARSPSMTPAKTSRWLLLFALLSFAFFVLIRAPAIFYNAPLNPDEAEMLANARKFTLDMDTWRSVDTSSGGPLDSFVLMWPQLIGKASGFATARVTALVILFGSWSALLWLPNQRTAGPRIVAMSCLMLVMGGTRMNDYLHYSSETVPLSLLVFAAVPILAMANRPADFRAAAAAAFLLGCVPFAKLQASPPALLMGLVLVWLTARSQPRVGVALRKLALVVAAALLPAMLILGPLLLTGNLDDFWKSYIGFAFGYLNGSAGVIAKASHITVLEAILAPSLLVFTYFAAMAGLFVVGIVANSAAIRKSWSPQVTALAIGAGFFASSLFAAITSGRAFPHYGYLLLMPVAAVAVLAWGLESPGDDAVSRTGRRSWLPTVGVGLILLVVVAGARTSNLFRYYGVTTAFSPAIMAPETFFGSGDLLADLPQTDRRALIWGWMPEWYVQSTAVPATRDMLSYNQTWPSGLRPYFRDRMMSDLRQSNPRFVLDAAAPGSFYYQDATNEGLASFPALKAHVDAAYVQISRSPHGDTCPRTFIRKDALAEFGARYAAIAAVSASASKVANGVAYTPDHLIDGVVFETCADRWLLPDHELGSVSLDLVKPQPLLSVEILNTRNGVAMDRATRSVEITGWNGASKLWVRRGELKRYPYWTRVAVAPGAGPVSRVTIAVQSFAGAGGGLNEVRLVPPRAQE